MQITELHIENFGKLHDFTLSLSAGLNEVIRENGYGKSTLSVFLSVMLFGFEGERKRDILESQRKRYAPWQGGVYGGRISFSTGDKSYVLERTFGIKDAKEDRFSLYDGETALPSEDYHESIGEELLHIDRESFVRTAFIGQMDMETNANARISAQMGNLAEEMADLRDFERVEKRLKDEKNKLSPTRATGQIRKLTEEIAVLKNSVQQEERKRETLRILEQEKNAFEKERERCDTRQRELQEKIKGISAKKDALQALLAKSQSYRELLERIARQQQAVEEARAFFPGEVPAREEIESAMALGKTHASLRALCQAGGLTAEESVRFSALGGQYPGGLPTEDRVQEAVRLTELLSQLEEEAQRKKLSQEEQAALGLLAQRFQGVTDPGTFSETLQGTLSGVHLKTQEERVLAGDRARLSEIGKRQALLQEEIARAEETKTRQQGLLENTRMSRGRGQGDRRRRKGTDSLTLFIRLLSAAVILFGIVLLALGMREGLVCLTAGGSSLSVSFLRRKKTEKEAEDAGSEEALSELSDLIDETNALLQQKREDAEKLKRECGGLRQKITEEEKALQETSGKLRAFCENYGLQSDAADLSEELLKLHGTFQEYQRLTEEKAAYQKEDFPARKEALLRSLRDVLSPYLSQSAMSDVVSLVKNLPRDREDYLRLSAKQERALQQESDRQAVFEELQMFFHRYGFQASEENSQEKLTAIRDARMLLSEAEKRCESSCQEKRVREAAPDFSDVLMAEQLSKQLAEETSIEFLTRSLSEAKAESDEILDKIHSEDGKIQDVWLELEGLKQEKARLSEKQEEKKERLHHYEILQKTQVLLTEAKNNLTMKYLAPYRDAFFYYYGMLEQTAEERYVVDAALDISLVEQGMRRDIRTLSAGYRDLVNLCKRMAMLDCMYPGDKPLLILDDPFVNLDEEKQKRARDFLRQAAEKYQILYLSCHR